VLSDGENKTALVIDTAVSLTHNLVGTEIEKITKCENLALVTKNIWKPNNVSIYTSVISAEELITVNFLQYLQTMGLTKYILRVGQNAVILLQTCHIIPKFLGHVP
jgi:hypothetical protein